MGLRPCLGPPAGGDCPSLALVEGGSRCAACRPTTAQRGLGGSYRQLAVRVIAEESACHLCLSPDLYRWRADDVWTADHVIPRSQGGPMTRENLRKAHRYCNSLKGATSDRR